MKVGRVIVIQVHNIYIHVYVCARMCAYVFVTCEMHSPYCVFPAAVWPAGLCL